MASESDAGVSRVLNSRLFDRALPASTTGDVLSTVAIRGVNHDRNALAKWDHWCHSIHNDRKTCSDATFVLFCFFSSVGCAFVAPFPEQELFFFFSGFF